MPVRSALSRNRQDCVRQPRAKIARRIYRISGGAAQGKSDSPYQASHQIRPEAARDILAAGRATLEELGLTKGQFVLATVHREETVDYPDRLRATSSQSGVGGATIIPAGSCITSGGIG